MRIRSLMASLKQLAGRHICTVARTRYKLSRAYLAGDGIEVGALHNPLPLSPRARVKYVDRLSQASLRQQYPELDHQKIVAPDIIDNGEELSLIRNESLDFIIANHLIEHCESPVATIASFLAKLKPGGIVYLAVPDKRFTFDSRRESTSLAHLESDYQDCGGNSREQHYLDFARQALLKDGGNESQVAQLARQMMETNYSIHFHVWTHEEFLDFLHWLRQHHLHRLEILEIVRNQGEGIFILRKQATVTAESAST